MTKEAKIALKLTGIILDYFGLKEGVYSKLKQIWDFSVEITEDSKLDEKQKFIIKLTQGITAFLKGEKAEDIEPKLEYTFSNHFDLQELMRCYDDHDKFSRYLIDKSWTRLHRNEDEFDAYEGAVKFVVNAIYENLKLFNVSKETEIASLEILFSLKQMQESFGDMLSDVNFMAHYRGSLAEFIEKSTLPPTFTGRSRFHYLNETVKFHGRKDELETVRVFLEQGKRNDGAYSNVHIWCISGAGGVGKSKFARHIAETYYDRYGVVWLNKDNVDKLLNAETGYFPYEKPLLIICDYANMLEDKLVTLVKKMSESDLSVYFLLIERCGQWFKEGFMKKEYFIPICAYSDEPLELSGKLSDEDYEKILDDFAKHDIYHGKSIDKTLVIRKTKELDESNRCLFLLLTADAYFMNDVPEKWSADALVESYIDRSKTLFMRNHKGSKTLCGSAFRMLALATALGGLNVRDKFPKNIKKDKDKIYPDRTTFRLIARQVSETNISGTTMPALEPDIIGEYLFISEFLNLNDSLQKEWLELLAESEPFETVLFRCVRDWRNETNELIEVMAETKAVSTAYIVQNTIRSIYDLEMSRKLLKLLDVVYNIDNCDEVASIYSLAIRHIFPFAYLDEKESLLKLLLRIEASLDDKEGKYAGYVYGNIGSVYYDSCNYDKALEYYEKDLAICEKILGKEHPDTATCYNNIGFIYKDKSDLDKALENYEKAKAVYEKILGKEHPNTATSYNNIGLIYQDKGDLDKSLEYYETALDIDRKFLGLEHLNTAASYNNIGNVYIEKGDLDKALEYLEKTKAIYEKVLSNEHPNNAISYNNIGGIYKNKGNLNKALEYYEKALDICEKFLGKEHAYTAFSYHNIGALYFERKEYETALYYLNKAFVILYEKLGKEHPDTQNTWEWIQAALSHLNENE